MSAESDWPDDTRFRRAWEWPRCPECRSRVYVGHYNGREQYVCHVCDVSFGPQTKTFGSKDHITGIRGESA